MEPFGGSKTSPTDVTGRAFKEPPSRADPHRMRNRKLIPAAVVTAGLLLAACGGDDEEGATATTVAAESTETTETTVAEETTDTTVAEETDGTTTTTTVAEGGCPSETVLEIGNGATAGLTDGPIADIEVFADWSLDQTVDLVFSSYPFPEDPQFGLSAPVGLVEVPEGEHFFHVSLFAGVDKTLEPGVYVDDDAAEPRIQFIDLYLGSERILPLGDHQVTITEITETEVCGTIEGSGDTALQSLPFVTGEFVALKV